MKVCTDACLFGALIPEIKKGEYHVLDIGTGTGLLSLMLAQRSPGALIDAIEIDEEAAKQAKANFEASPWKDRLNTTHTDLLNFDPKHKYDLIISNPPFFEGDLLSDDHKKNSAKHDSSLTLEQLLERANTLLAEGGMFCVLLPYHRIGYFEDLALQYDFYLEQKISVRQTPKHDFFRGILFFRKEKTELKVDEIVVKGGDGEYSEAFVSVLKDFYLYL